MLNTLPTHPHTHTHTDLHGPTQMCISSRPQDAHAHTLVEAFSCVTDGNDGGEDKPD